MDREMEMGDRQDTEDTGEGRTERGGGGVGEEQRGVGEGRRGVGEGRRETEMGNGQRDGDGRRAGHGGYG